MSVTYTAPSAAVTNQELADLGFQLSYSLVAAAAGSESEPSGAVCSDQMTVAEWRANGCGDLSDARPARSWHHVLVAAAAALVALGVIVQPP